MLYKFFISYFFWPFHLHHSPPGPHFEACEILPLQFLIPGVLMVLVFDTSSFPLMIYYFITTLTLPVSVFTWILSFFNLSRLWFSLSFFPPFWWTLLELSVNFDDISILKYIVIYNTQQFSFTFSQASSTLPVNYIFDNYCSVTYFI